MTREPTLFGEEDGSEPWGGSVSEPSNPSFRPGAPLAARMRPRSLEEFRGQEHLLGEGRPLRRMLEGGALQSCILWGPPGSGKTTLARLLAHRSDARFVPLSAVTDGVGRVREIVAEARTRREATGQATLLFCDEIHRFNRSQQDAFLPHVEDGTLILFGATTENPSFELNRPLLSRAPVFPLHPLAPEAVVEILRDALQEGERGLGKEQVAADPDALLLLAVQADGDARRALGALEAAVRSVGKGGRIGVAEAREALQLRFAVYDRSGEEHFNLISALHKSVRGSHPDAALYWLARMIRGGEDPLYIARRVVRMATEDIGLADPQALTIALAAWKTLEVLGSPEGELALAEAVTYLSTAPKSNRIYVAWKEALRLAEDSPSAPVPLHLRNAPTREMQEWGYGRGYHYDPEMEGGISPQGLFPEMLGEPRLYRPGSQGLEPEIERRTAAWEALREKARAQPSGEEPPMPNSG